MPGDARVSQIVIPNAVPFKQADPCSGARKRKKRGQGLQAERLRLNRLSSRPRARQRRRSFR